MPEATDTEAAEMGVEKAVAASRRLHPELWAKADKIAEMIDPAAFDQGWTFTEESAHPKPYTTRQKYMQARARRLAFEILRYLEIAPATTDWAAIFEEMRDAANV